MDKRISRQRIELDAPDSANGVVDCGTPAFSRLEQAVIQLALHDSAIGTQAEGRLCKAVRLLTKKVEPNRLANRRLEALRCYTIAASEGEERANGALSPFLAAGYSQAQACLVRSLTEGHRRSSSQRLICLLLPLALASFAVATFMLVDQIVDDRLISIIVAAVFLAASAPIVTPRDEKPGL